MMTIRRSCNLQFFHLAHSTTVMLIDEMGVMTEPATVFCGGTQDEELQKARSREG